MSHITAGIITFHTAINYGAVLQAVALQNAFRELNVSSEIVDYQNEKFANQYGLQVKFQTSNPIKILLLVLVKNFFFLQKKIKFQRFLKEYAALSKKRYNFQNIVECANNYNRFITGSDQVWNLELTGEDTRYFLDFVPRDKKSSYAASFGKQKIEEEKISLYKDLLSDFEIISLREMSGIDVFRQLELSKKLLVHIDPTLLFDGKWWSKICWSRPKYKYILFYKVAAPNNLISYIEDFSSKTGIQVIEVGADLKRSSKKFKMIRSAGPEEFISLIKNAEYVATTSFHATAFSILFHKKMILELVDSTGKFNVRIADLLCVLDIDINTLSNIAHIEHCEWNKIDDTLKKLRSNAFSYLSSISRFGV